MQCLEKKMHKLEKYASLFSVLIEYHLCWQNYRSECSCPKRCINTLAFVELRRKFSWSCCIFFINKKKKREK